MDELFPFYGEKTNTQVKMQLYKEIAWDFENNKPLIENGSFKYVEGKEAIKTWCYKTLQVNRYRYLIHSWNYGNDLENLIGKNYSKVLIQSECTRYVKECLLINPYIKGVSNIIINFDDGKLIISCSINTIYGDADMEGVKIFV